MSPRQLLDQLPRTNPQLFEIEWKAVDQSNDLQIQALAVIAHDRTKHTLDDLGCVLRADRASLIGALQALGFLVIPADHAGEVSFVSESFRKFAAIQLGDWKEFVNDRVIEALLADPDSSRSISKLPGYLQKAGRSEELLNYLSAEHFVKMLEQSQSLTPIHQHVELGLAAALNLKDDGEVLRFGIQEAAIASLDKVTISRAEIFARVAVGDHDSAVALAYAAVLRHDRLRLLSALARAQQERRNSPDFVLVEQIQQLLKTIDVRELGESAIDLASDLMYFQPDAAIKAVERMTKTPDDRSVDFALARLSIAGAATREIEQGHVRAIADDARRKIQDPELFKLSTTVSLVLGEYSANQIISEVEKLNNPIDRIYLLRQWTLNTTDYTAAPEVIEYAFKLAVKTSEYTPNATHLRELATALPNIRRTIPLQRLIGLFDSQKSRTQELGPTEDYVRLQLLLAEGEGRYAFVAASGRLLEIYLYIGEISSDVVTKTSCLANFIATLARVDPGKVLQKSDKLHTWAEDELRRNVDILLNETAEQFFVLRHVLKGLALQRPELALEIATRLNTEYRRDEALVEICRSQVGAALAEIPYSHLGQALNTISDSDLQDDVLHDLLDRLASSSKAFPSFGGKLDQIVPFIERAARIGDARIRAWASCAATKILSTSKESRYDRLCETTVEVMGRAWEAIDDDWQRVEAGFSICSTLADANRDIALQYMKKADRFRSELALREANSGYGLAVNLALRAFSGLIANKADTEEELHRLEQAIEKTPSLHRRTVLWTDLALRYFSGGQNLKGRKIVSDRIRPLLDSLRASGQTQWSRAGTAAAPALYCSNKTLALEYVAQLPQAWRDLAYDGIIEFLLERQPRSEPFEGADNRYPITYDSAFDICEVLKCVQLDSFLYRHVKDLVQSLLWKQNREITQEQRSDIGKRLQEIVSTRLPSPRFIKHQGFKVIALAQLSRLQRISRADWNAIADEARKISNPADRAMVLSVVASCCQDLKEQQELFREARQTIDTIPCALDRVDRLQILAGEAYDWDLSLCKQALRDAAVALPESESAEFDSVQRRVIDLAHRVSGELAGSLVSEWEQDTRGWQRGRAPNVKSNSLI